MFGIRRKHRTDAAGSAGKRKRHFLSYKRRWGIWGAMFLLLGGLIAYNYFTQDARVRAVVESVLSDRFGGPVHAGRASFSIVGGLKIGDVTVDVDDRKLADSRLMTAKNFRVELSPLKLLSLNPARAVKSAIKSIEAEGVEVRLCEDMGSETWNFQRLLRPVSGNGGKDEGGPSASDMQNLPTVHILDARVTYLRTEKDVLREVGDVRAEITIFPMPRRQYGFNVVARAEGKPTRVLGMFDRRQELLTGKVSELDFDHALRRMLPTKVGKWFDDLR